MGQLIRTEWYHFFIALENFWSLLFSPSLWRKWWITVTVVFEARLPFFTCLLKILCWREVAIINKGKQINMLWRFHSRYIAQFMLLDTAPRCSKSIFPQLFFFHCGLLFFLWKFITMESLLGRKAGILNCRFINNFNWFYCSHYLSFSFTVNCQWISLLTEFPLVFVMVLKNNPNIHHPVKKNVQ